MVCKQCGRELPDHAIYCRYCGARVADPRPAEPDEPVITGRRPRRVLPVVIAVLALAALLAGLFLWLHGRNDPEPEPITEPEPVEEPVVEPEPPADYTVRIEGEDNIEAGKSVILKAVILPETEIERAEWSSSNLTVATVLDGVVTGIQEGDAMIRCRIVTKDARELKAEMPFRVLPKPVSYKAELTPKTLELHAGSAEDLSVEVTSDPRERT